MQAGFVGGVPLSDCCTFDKQEQYCLGLFLRHRKEVSHGL